MNENTQVFESVALLSAVFTVHRKVSERFFFRVSTLTYIKRENIAYCEQACLSNKHRGYQLTVKSSETADTASSAKYCI